MNRTNVNRTQSRGFTLIEILIVVVILGILAAIVIPQFTNAAQDANVSSARSQLQTMRSQIELYRVQNNGAIPANPWTELQSGSYIRAAPVWPSGFQENYSSGNLTLEYDGTFDADGDGSNEAAGTDTGW
jgi:general secretion pathway protein G